MVDLDKIPPFHEPKKVNASIKEYAKMLQADGIVTNFYAKVGTMGMADVQNQMGGLPVRNFSAGRLADVAAGEKFKMGGDYIGQLNTSRGGEQTHACMPGCVIQCSNVYHDANGKEVVSPVEYETLGLLGTNCGISDPDDLAQLNYVANDLGVDTIELGATLAVLMEAGLGEFGDVKFMTDCLVEIRKGTEKGRLWAQGTARVGEHYKVSRVPVIKKQAISAYDPRVVEATGISMMATAQGADHTAGNLPRLKTREMDLESLVSQSLLHQTRVAANDSLGLCIFGMSVTNPNTEFLTNAINAAHGTTLTPDFFEALGPRRAAPGEGVQPPGRLHREGRRAARVLLHGGAAPDQPRGALPRRRRAPDVRAPARVTMWVAAALAGLIHVLFFCMESLWWTKPAVYRRFRSTEAQAQTDNLAFNQGLLFAGLLPRLAFPRRDDPGRWNCASMLAAAVVLAASSPQMMRGALIQGLPPLASCSARYTPG